MAGTELPERELELIAMVAREIAALDQIIHELYNLVHRISTQRSRLDDLEKALRQHTQRKGHAP